MMFPGMQGLLLGVAVEACAVVACLRLVAFFCNTEADASRS